MAAAPLAALAQPLTLERAVELALSRNERPLIAREEVAAAEARLARARSYFFPSVALTGTYTRQPPVQRSGLSVRPSNSLVATGAINVTIFDGSAIPVWRAAVQEAAASADDARNEARLVAFEAADAFLQTLGAEQVANAAERRLALARRSLEEARVRFKAQLVSSNDVTRAEVELANAEQAATRARGDATTARLNLSLLLAEDVTRVPLEEAPLAAEPISEEAVKALVDRGTEQRPDVAAARKRQAAADVLASEPLWRFIPSLSVGAEYNLNNVETAFAPAADWRATATLRWELFDPSRLADWQEGQARAKVARLQAQATERAAKDEVARARVALTVAEAAVKQAAVAAEAARRNADETNALYREGLARAIEVADASVGLYEAEVALARERYARSTAWLTLRAAVGLDPLGREL
ncbi:MAG: TolC family protein [Myxococcaceae bacterium]|nr:TolC family protein [Myxococcaceae bacterium]